MMTTSQGFSYLPLLLLVRLCVFTYFCVHLEVFTNKYTTTFLQLIPELFKNRNNFTYRSLSPASSASGAKHLNDEINGNAFKIVVQRENYL
jgi:hypothetical protein